MHDRERKGLITLIGGAVAWPAASHEQQPTTGIYLRSVRLRMLARWEECTALYALASRGSGSVFLCFGLESSDDEFYNPAGTTNDFRMRFSLFAGLGFLVVIGRCASQGKRGPESRERSPGRHYHRAD
jgi:hypothetical protein